MINNYLKVAFRNIFKRKGYTLINISGLGIGIASFLLIVFYISDETSYDRYHENADRIYRVCRLYNANDVYENAASCSFPLGPALEFANRDKIEHVVRFFNFQSPKFLIENRNNKDEIVKYNERRFFFVDSTVFKVFTFPFVAGNPETALDRPNTLVITQSMAKKYFGEEDPIGKTLLLEERGEFEITGILEDIPSQSHFVFDFLASMSSVRANFRGREPQTWIWNPCWTYALLKPGVSPSELESRLPQFHLNHYHDFKNQDIKLYLQSLPEIHLNSHLDYEITKNSYRSYIYILTAIAIFILIIACINFTNLSTATSADRAKEIGTKKVFGAQRKQIAFQILGESALTCLLAILLGLVIVEIMLPYFNDFAGKEIPTLAIFNIKWFGLTIVLWLSISILSGSYPAFVLSAFKPVAVLKGTLKKGSKSAFARKILVITQFSISTALIIGTVFIFYQLQFLRKADLGFKKDRIILVPTVNQVLRNYDALVEELMQQPGITNVTGMEDVIGKNHNTHNFEIEGFEPGEQYFYPALMVRHNFIETFEIKILAGRGFSLDHPTDTADAVVINESMARHLGWTNEEAIGKRFKKDRNEVVIGVMEDFNALSLHKPAGNFVLDMLPTPGAAAFWTRYLAIKVNTSNIQEVLEKIEESWKKFAPTRPFEYSFLKEDLHYLYQDEDMFGKFSLILTVLTIFIAALGLFGLTSFLAEQRTREIGIRKALGSSIPSIFFLLSKEFVLLIAIANLIAWPISWLLMTKWLDNFSTQVGLNPLVFLFAGITTLLLALMISGYKAIKITSLNPAKTLKYE